VGDQPGSAGVLGGEGGFEFDKLGDGLGVGQVGDLLGALLVALAGQPFRFADLLLVPVAGLSAGRFQDDRTSVLEHVFESTRIRLPRRTFDQIDGRNFCGRTRTKQLAGRRNVPLTATPLRCFVFPYETQPQDQAGRT